MYSFGRKYKNNPLIGTFVRENIKTGLYEMIGHKATYSLYVAFVTPEEKQEMLDKIRDFTESTTKFKYNFTGLINYALGKESHRKDAYFCSQFVATIFNSAGKDYFNRDASLVKPYDFAKNKNFYFVTRGILSNYNSGVAEANTRKIKKKNNGE